jgi:tellurite resistance protein TerC
MIGLGVALVTRFHWVLYLFGLFLLFTGIKMLFPQEQEVELEKNIVLRLCRRFMSVTPDYVEEKFLAHHNGKLMFTPLALVLVVLNFIDLVFAVDSIPAIFAVTTDPFIVYTSNICAVLGLRSLYFLIAHVVYRFVYLKYGLALVLSFIGAKMLIADFWKMPTWVSLSVVLGLLTISIVASLFATPKAQPLDGQHTARE